MSDPRRPDDARLSTADLAAAGERTKERVTDQSTTHDPQRQTQPGQAQPTQGQSARAQTDRDVTRDVQRVQQERQAAGASANRQAADQDRPTPMFAHDETDEFRRRWNDIQTGFVDEPRQAVERADALVAAAIKRLAESFAQERGVLEQQWARGADVSTEDLRVALRKYRGFFDRLLSV